MAKTQSFAIGALAACFAMSLSGDALAVTCMSANKTSPAECQSPADSNSSAALPAASNGIYLGMGKQYVLFHSYPSDILPKFITNNTGKNIFVPQGSIKEFNAFLTSAPQIGVTTQDAIVPGKYTLKPVNVCGLKGLHVLNPATLKEPALPLAVPKPNTTTKYTLPATVTSLSDGGLYTPLFSTSSSSFEGIVVLYTADNRPGYTFKEIQKIQFAPGQDASGNWMTCWGGTTRTAGPKNGQVCTTVAPQITASEFYYSKTTAPNVWLPVQNVKCPEDGICGSDAGTIVSPPTTLTDMCTSGVASAATLVSNSYYTWTCGGAQGGTAKTCSTIGKATCNSSLTEDDFASGSPANLCSTGTPTAVTTGTAATGEKTWNWTCTSATTSATCTVKSTANCPTPACLSDGVNYPFGIDCDPTCGAGATGYIYDLFKEQNLVLSNADGIHVPPLDNDSSGPIADMSLLNAGALIKGLTITASQFNMANTGVYNTKPMANFISAYNAAYNNVPPASSANGYHQYATRGSWFGLCYDGSFSVPSDGWYTFVTRVDDAVAVYVDGYSHGSGKTYLQDPSNKTSFTGLVGEAIYGFVPGPNTVSSPDFNTLYGTFLADYPSLFGYNNSSGQGVTYPRFLCRASATQCSGFNAWCIKGYSCPAITMQPNNTGGSYVTNLDSVYLKAGTHNIEIKYINGWGSGMSLGLGLVAGTATPGAAHSWTGPLSLGPAQSSPMSCPK